MKHNDYEVDLERMSTKKRIKFNWRKVLRTYLMCVIIAGIIYAVAVIENYYQKNILENPNAQPLFIIASILFIGFLVLLLVLVSPPFGKALFRVFGLEEGESK